MRTIKKTQLQDQEPEVLDEATLAAIDKADQSFREGKGMTIAEARELNRKRYRAWQKIAQDLSE